MFHDARVTFVNVAPPPTLHEGGSGTWEGGTFTLASDALSTTNVKFKNTSGSQKTISVVDLAVTSVVAKLGGGNEANITATTTCIISQYPSGSTVYPVNIPPDASAQFSVSCDLPGVYKEVNITLRAEINPDKYYFRTYTVKGN
jgi:hypothetical protein